LSALVGATEVFKQASINISWNTNRYFNY